MYLLEDVPVMLDGGFAGVLEHVVHMLAPIFDMCGSNAISDDDFAPRCYLLRGRYYGTL